LASKFPKIFYIKPQNIVPKKFQMGVKKIRIFWLGSNVEEKQMIFWAKIIPKLKRKIEVVIALPIEGFYGF